MNDFLSQFVQAFLMASIPPLAGMLAAYLVGLIRKTWLEVRSYAGDWVWLLDEAARIAVRAAEQMELAEIISDKKQYAVATVDAFLKEKGFTVDLSLIEAAIEAAVLREFGKN